MLEILKLKQKKKRKVNVRELTMYTCHTTCNVINKFKKLESHWAIPCPCRLTNVDPIPHGDAPSFSFKSTLLISLPQPPKTHLDRSTEYPGLPYGRLSLSHPCLLNAGPTCLKGAAIATDNLAWLCP